MIPLSKTLVKQLEDQSKALKETINALIDQYASDQHTDPLPLIAVTLSDIQASAYTLLRDAADEMKGEAI